MIIALCVLLSLVLLVHSGFLLSLAMTLCFAFMTIRMDDTIVMDYLGYTTRLFITSPKIYAWRVTFEKTKGKQNQTPGQEKRRRKKGGCSVQELMGIRGFTRYGLDTVHGELLFFRIAPINISVLSHDNIEIKIHSLQTALTMMPDLGIFCTDSCESFDTNKAYLRKQERREGNAEVRRLLHQDAQMLTELQAEMSIARQFVFVRRCSGLKQEQVLSFVNNTHKQLADIGFEVQRMKEPDIKRFLAIYFKRLHER